MAAVEFLFFVSLLFLVFGIPETPPQEFDCGMRQLALDYAQKIQPFRGADDFQEIADALNGAQEAQGCNVSIRFPAAEKFVPSFSPSPDASVVYVSTFGNDNNPGTVTQPLQTIGAAVALSRTMSGPVTISIFGGTYFLTETIFLGPEDNNLQFQNYQGQEVWISGGKPIVTSWEEYNVTAGVNLYNNSNAVYGATPDNVTVEIYGKTQNYSICEVACVSNELCRSFTWHDENQGIYAFECWFRFDNVFQLTPESGHISGLKVDLNVWVSDLTGQDFTQMLGLRLNGERAIRARYPNANPEIDGFGSTLQATSWVPPAVAPNPNIEVAPTEPLRNSSLSFQTFQLGINGSCYQFVPPAGYWCGNETQGGGAFTYRSPSGMTFTQQILPNSPYQDPIGAVIQTWRPAHWSSWMFEIGEYDAEAGEFLFSKGGFQGARGDDMGEDFYIEAVFEELDYPAEWFFNASTQKLYYFNNGTGSPPTTGFVATNLKTLFMVSGTQAEPVQGVSFEGLGFRDTAYTYLDPHGMPSGGDWALERFGSLFFEGTVNTTIDSCTFWRLDGNGVMISAFNRNFTIQNSEFAWIGDTAIAQWGNTTGVEEYDSSIIGMGVDGTDGNQPRGTSLLNNFVHELGIWEKQSSFYFQAKSCQTLISGNIFFNGPRAGINFNDGFGGGSELTENLLFNTCRESADHGPFNSWDRQVYMTDVLNGSPSVTKQWDEIHHNFILANYNSQEAIDNDDGSCYYWTHDNFFAYSGNGMKNDFGGHDNHHWNNIYAFVGSGFSLCSQLDGHEDYFYNNTVVLTQDGNYGGGTCSGEGKTVVYDNKIFSPTGDITECGQSLSQWQAQGNDPGTTAASYPDPSVMLQWIEQLLSIPSSTSTN